MGNNCTKKSEPPQEIEPPLTTIEELELNEEEQAIERMVDRYLANKQINSKFIPDAIERKMYKNMLRILIGLLKDTFNNAHVDLLGHRVSFSMHPINNETTSEHQKDLLTLLTTN